MNSVKSVRMEKQVIKTFIRANKMQIAQALEFDFENIDL